jgi:hypothetical protein
VARAVSVFFLGWGQFFLGWAGANTPTPPAQVPPSLGAGAPRRFVVPIDMAIAARRLADDLDATIIIEAIVASGILQRDTR